MIIIARHVFGHRQEHDVGRSVDVAIPAIQYMAILKRVAVRHFFVRIRSFAC